MIQSARIYSIFLSGIVLIYTAPRFLLQIFRIRKSRFFVLLVPPFSPLSSANISYCRDFMSIWTGVRESFKLREQSNCQGTASPLAKPQGVHGEQIGNTVWTLNGFLVSLTLLGDFLRKRNSISMWLFQNRNIYKGYDPQIIPVTQLLALGQWARINNNAKQQTLFTQSGCISLYLLFGGSMIVEWRLDSYNFLYTAQQSLSSPITFFVGCKWLRQTEQYVWARSTFSHIAARCKDAHTKWRWAALSSISWIWRSWTNPVSWVY